MKVHSRSSQPQPPEIWAKAGDIGNGIIAGAGDIGNTILTWVEGAWATLASKWPEIWTQAGDITNGLFATVADLSIKVEAWLKTAWGDLSAKWPSIWAAAGDIGRRMHLRCGLSPRSPVSLYRWRKSPCSFSPSLPS